MFSVLSLCLLLYVLISKINFRVLCFSINECNREEPTIFVILTGWNDKYNKNLPFYFKVPYSSHSNYRELEKFVKAVNPGKLIFNVHERNDTKKRQEFQSYLAREYEKKVAQQPNQPAAISNFSAKNGAGILPESERYRNGGMQNSNYFNGGAARSSFNKHAAITEGKPSIAAGLVSKPVMSSHASSLLHPAIALNTSYKSKV